jgi:hypothetical protein
LQGSLSKRRQKKFARCPSFTRRIPAREFVITVFMQRSRRGMRTIPGACDRFSPAEPQMNARHRAGSSLPSILDTTAFESECGKPGRKKTMKTISKLAIGAVLACGVAVAATAPAEAGVRIGFGVGVPVVAQAYPATCYNYYGQPYYCGYGPGYVGVGFGGGYWGGHGHGGWGHGGHGGGHHH